MTSVIKLILALVIASNSKDLLNSTGGLGSQIKENHNQNTNQALFISWSIMGLWHGANWTFLIWGIYHASVIYIHRMISQLNFLKINPIISLFIMLAVMMLSWIPFRAESISHTFALWGLIINPAEYLAPLGLRENAYILAAVLLLGFFWAYGLRSFLFDKIASKKVYLLGMIEIFFLSALILLTLIFLRPINQFIYFQF